VEMVSAEGIEPSTY